MSNPSTQLIDINSLLAGEWNQFESLLAFCLPPSKAGHSQPISKQKLIEIFAEQSLSSDKLLSIIPATESLDSNCYAVLAFADQLFGNYSRNSQLHPDINQLLSRLRPALATSMLNETLPWRQDHLTKLFNTVYHNALGWEPELGRASVRYLDQLKSIFDQFTGSEKSLQKTLTALVEFFNKDKSRVSKLESRLRDAEIGSLHAKHAHQLSAKTLNQQMAGKKLPATIAKFLQGPWRESMRLLIISKGKDSEEWRRINRLTETLIWSFQPISPENNEQKQHIINSISELSEELREVTIGLHHSSNIDHELSLIEQQHLKILKSEPLTYAPFVLIDNTDPLISSTASISSTLLNKVSSFNEGQWFIHHSEHGDKRIKLCIKISHAKQLLFTNFLGIKVSHTGFEDFAYLLSSKIVIPIDSRDPLKATGEKMTSVFFERYQQQSKQISDEAAIEKEIILQQQRARDTARKKAIIEAVASKQARINARKETQKIKIDKPDAVNDMSSNQKKNEAKSGHKSSDLHVGAKVEFINQNNEKQLCKLAAIIQSSKQYIFIDRSGVKRYALQAQELDEKLATRTATVIERGSTFEGALEKVVNNLRDRKNL